MTYYVRDRRTGGEIVNAIESSSRQRAADAMARMEGADDLYLDPDPPTAVLARYRYWSERP